ncbi:MAG: hypothetical protein HY698_19330 [Deltaproteobacteria bacterium]|nr:hypothetical protein [Deltaproteobacteria bacterium]
MFMRPLIAPRLVPIFFVLSALGCGNKIGDSCETNADCSAEGGRTCDPAPNSPGGYCTIANCDFGTCPDEATCVRFFPVSQIQKECSAGCALDEACVMGKCAPRKTEVRFCMLKCDSHGDCRDNYECRDATRMTAHGGEPVQDPNAAESKVGPSFCAPSKTCTRNEDCDLGDTCPSPTSAGNLYCQRP